MFIRRDFDKFSYMDLTGIPSELVEETIEEARAEGWEDVQVIPDWDDNDTVTLMLRMRKDFELDAVRKV